MKLKGYFLYHVMIIRKILMSFFFKIKEIKRENNSVFNIIYVGSCFDKNNLKYIVWYFHYQSSYQLVWWNTKIK
jgi:hypothetical protein